MGGGDAPWLSSLDGWHFGRLSSWALCSRLLYFTRPFARGCRPWLLLIQSGLDRPAAGLAFINQRLIYARAIPTWEEAAFGSFALGESLLLPAAGINLGMVLAF